MAKVPAQENDKNKNDSAIAKSPAHEIDKKDVLSLLEDLSPEIAELYNFRDMFFENHPIEMAEEKNKLIEEKMNALAQKFDNIEEEDVPVAHRAHYLFMKGRVYNVSVKYDPRATQCLSKAVKLDPHMVSSWNDLGESYWKNKNIQDAKSCFEGALQQKRNRMSLRCLSIILRQEASHSARLPGELATCIQRSQDLAKEAVEQDPKDGQSWSVLGNAHLCRYFLVAQDPKTLRAAMSAYRQAEHDPIARGLPDLYYNTGVAQKYSEQYGAAMASFARATALDPPWDVPGAERAQLLAHLRRLSALLGARGKIKAKKLRSMVQSLEAKLAGGYAARLTRLPLAELTDGENTGTYVLGRVVGSVHGEGVVPFTFALIDASMACVCVTVYNWADGRGVIIGDAVAIPAPAVTSHDVTIEDERFEFKSIRVNSPTLLLVNGKAVGRNQVAGTQLRSTYECH